jgi:hypothetical protein
MACFTCEKGNHELKLNETYHFYEEKVWCPSHFKELFVVRCTKCSEVISGDYSNVEKKPYHSACLTELTAELKAKADRVVSFDALRDGNYPAFVDADKKETYLSESDFESIFKQSRAQFSSLPAWKQKRAKLEHGLN